jgi:peptidoglycan/xylan/chitin deacetylase (PgdA/CDA1 family)/GT2 family glycosyltransferase
MGSQTDNPSLLHCTVVVTTWKRPTLLAQTLRSWLEQSYPAFDIIVVCDGEDVDVLHISREFATHSLIRWIFHPANMGLPTARNTGVREASGDIVLFSDDDIIAIPDLVSLHMKHHNQAGTHRRFWVGGRIIESPRSDLETYLNRRLHESWSQVLERGIEYLTNAEHGLIGDVIEQSVWCGLNCSVSRREFLGIGGYDERLRASDEEMELGQRLYRAGLELVVEPEASVVHQNTKDLTEYHRRGWRASGALDTYRVLEKGQKVPQTQHLASMFHGALLDRAVAMLCWHQSEPMGELASEVEELLNQSEWSPLFGLWSRICRSSEYWNGAKAAGCSLEKLQAIAGKAKCALMLHSLAEPLSPAESTYYLHPRKFRRFMEVFQFTGYQTASIDQWMEDQVPAKHVLLTFDDGYEDLYDHLLPMVIERKYRPIIFLVADHIGGVNTWDQLRGLRSRRLLSLDQIREMQKYGVDFGSHTMTHPWLPEVSDLQLYREVRDSKSRLEDLLGKEVNSFSYPWGGVDMRVRSAVAGAGYKAGFTIRPGVNWWNDPLCQNRADVHEYVPLLSVIFQLRYGRTPRELISDQMRNLEQTLPSGALRRMARSARKAGHIGYTKISKRRRALGRGSDG